MKKKAKIGILVSGSGTNMQSIVERCRKGEMNAEVAFVGTDKPDCKGLAWAKEQGLPTIAFNFSQNRKNPVRPDGFQEIYNHLLAKYNALIRSWYDSGFLNKSVDAEKYFYWKEFIQFQHQ